MSFGDRPSRFDEIERLRGRIRALEAEVARLRSLVEQYELVLASGEKYVAEYAGEWKAIAEGLRADLIQFAIREAQALDLSADADTLAERAQRLAPSLAAFDRKAGTPQP